MESSYGIVSIWECTHCQIEQTIRPLWKRREELPDLSQWSNPTPVCPLCDETLLSTGKAPADSVFKEPLKPVIPHKPDIKHRFSAVPGEIICSADAMSFCRQRPDCDGRWEGNKCTDHRPYHLVLPSQPCWAKEWLEYSGLTDSAHYYGEEVPVPGRKIELLHIGNTLEGWSWVYALKPSASKDTIADREDLRRDYYTI